ncbi:hypothetical protein DEU56DRAFT_733794, partial [Suillus clintonianus]|uniref:uncharacterized protein n=1 Tax=Suillus clintonianus TaxID=1904413 RepID=UPI001B885F92
PMHIRLISPEFPWTFNIGPSAKEEGVTCFDVLAALHVALQCPLTDTEWGTASDDKRATRTSLAPGANVPQEPLLLRVDWLGSRVAFLGLVKDDAFARSRLIPGGGQPPETWVVKFRRL